MRLNSHKFYIFKRTMETLNGVCRYNRNDGNTAATAAPKLSMLSENAKMQKSRNELDKISRQALHFSERASVEARAARLAQ